MERIINLKLTIFINEIVRKKKVLAKYFWLSAINFLI